MLCHQQVFNHRHFGINVHAGRVRIMPRRAIACPDNPCTGFPRAAGSARPPVLAKPVGQLKDRGFSRAVRDPIRDDFATGSVQATHCCSPPATPPKRMVRPETCNKIISHCAPSGFPHPVIADFQVRARYATAVIPAAARPSSWHHQRPSNSML